MYPRPGRSQSAAQSIRCHFHVYSLGCPSSSPPLAQISLQLCCLVLFLAQAGYRGSVCFHYPEQQMGRVVRAQNCEGLDLEQAMV